MRNPVSYYRVLCWLATLIAAGAVIGCLLVSARLKDVHQAVPSPRSPVDLHAVSRYRDQNFEFVIRNYGFEYEGRTGDAIDDSILLCGLWEKDLAFFMRDYLERRGHKDAVFIDVGCNAGQHSLFLSRHVKQIHAFDPYLPAVERFRKMIDRNGFGNIIVHPVGLGTKDEELPFVEPPENNFGIGSFRHPTESLPVASSTLRIVRGDDWLDEYKLSDVELIKIDIEGFEEFALRGLQQTLESHRPVCVVEVTRPPDGTIASFAELQSLFPQGYQFLVFVADERTYLTGRYQLQRFEPLADEFFRNGFQINLVAYPSEKSVQVPRGH